jgi:hypothetical protein
MSFLLSSLLRFQATSVEHQNRLDFVGDEHIQHFHSIAYVTASNITSYLRIMLMVGKYFQLLPSGVFASSQLLGARKRASM